MVLAPIFLLLTIGLRNLIHKTVPKGMAKPAHSTFKIALNNNLHIMWFLIIGNESFSQSAFGGFSPAGLEFPEINRIWTWVRVTVYFGLFLVELWAWSRIKTKAAESSQVALMLMATDTIAIIFALLFLNPQS